MILGVLILTREDLIYTDVDSKYCSYSNGERILTKAIKILDNKSRHGYVMNRVWDMDPGKRLKILAYRLFFLKLTDSDSEHGSRYECKWWGKEGRPQSE